MAARVTGGRRRNPVTLAAVRSSVRAVKPPPIATAIVAAWLATYAVNMGSALARGF